jgi:hypothetical protein
MDHEAIHHISLTMMSGMDIVGKRDTVVNHALLFSVYLIECPARVADRAGLAA